MAKKLSKDTDREDFAKPVKEGSSFFTFEPGPDSVMLVSRLDHPETIDYKGTTIILPPRGRVSIFDKKLLGRLPTRVYTVPLKK